MKVIMFPGQGSQFKGMGGELFNVYNQEAELASNILGYDIKELCLRNSKKNLDSTEFTQPALFVVNSFNYYEIIKKQQNPNFLIGHSLGEYNALLAAGAFTFETGLKLVQKRGELMAKSSDGAMAAVLGISIKELKKILSDGDYHDIDVANYNTYTQTVIAGKNDSITKLLDYFNSKSIKAVKLNVSAPFHSRYMKPAAAEFADFIKGFEFFPLTTPVISNVTGKIYKNELVSNLLIQQIKSSVKWTDSIQWLIDQGVQDFQEVGGLFLGKMVKDIIQFKEVRKNGLEKEILSPNEDNIQNEFDSTNLGNTVFKKEYNVKYSYLVGSMYKGISSKELVVKLGKAYMLGFLGTKEMTIDDIEENILWIKGELQNNEPFGVNISSTIDTVLEEKQIEIFIKNKIHFVETSGFSTLTLSLIRYRLIGLRKDVNGKIICENKIIAKVSSYQEAELFMNPAPEAMVKFLLEEGLITQEQALLSSSVPMSHDICVESDSGWNSNRKSVNVIFPAIYSLKDRIQKKHQYAIHIRIGLAGGIGTPQAAAIAYLIGADFIMTGSINQCTLEAGTSDVVKDLLQKITIQDTGYITKSNSFQTIEQQILRKNVIFYERFRKIQNFVQSYRDLENIPKDIVEKLEKDYLKISLKEILGNKSKQSGINEILDFYYNRGIELSIKGKQQEQNNFLIHTSSSLGAFNQLVEGSPIESWRARHVDEIGKYILDQAVKILQSYNSTFFSKN